MADILAVARVSPLGQAEFTRRHVETAAPVIVTGGADSLDPGSWTPERLVTRMGDRPVDVSISATRTFGYQHAGSAFGRQTMSVRDAAAAIHAAGADGGVYLMQQAVTDPLIAHGGPLRPPEVIGDQPAAPHLWFGSAGNVTPLHYDGVSNYFAQLYGRKRFILIDPVYFEDVYPYPIDAEYSHVSAVDAERPDADTHPRFLDVPRWQAELGPGDLLYLPAFWWHHVRSLDVSVSVNFWCAPPLAQCLVPAGLRILRAMYDRDRLAGLGAPFRDARH